MPSSAPQTDPCNFRFGVFEFNGATLALARNGVSLRLRPQPARLLRLLLSRAGELVTRETIRESLWNDGTTVDFEIGVNRCVRQLRAALLDDSDAPRYVKTIPRIGYSFIAPVTTVRTGAPSQQAVRVDCPPESTVEDAERPPSIVVLPFASLSSAPDDEYFSDGLTEEIINTLAQLPGLKVIARTSAFAFKGRNEDIREIAETLGVGNVLEGSVRRAGSRVRVTAQLIHAADGTHLSSKRYDGEMDDIFAFQDEISADIAEQLKVRFALRKRSTTKGPVYQTYLEGRYHWNKFTPEGFAKAFDCFQQAAALDPGYGPAYSGMALYQLGRIIDFVGAPRELLPEAAAAARRALELDERDADAHSVLGDIATMLDRDWTAAARHFRRAHDLQAGTSACIGSALWFLAPQERWDEAEAMCDELLEQDPLYRGGYTARAIVLLLQRKYDAAAEQCLRATDLDPAYQGVFQYLAYIRAFQGRIEEALGLAERLIGLRGKSYGSLFALGTAHAVAGDRAAAHQVLEEMRRLPGAGLIGASTIACIHALLGEWDAAFEWMGTAVKHSDPRALWMKSLPWLDSLRSDSRYHDLLLKMGLAAGG